VWKDEYEPVLIIPYNGGRYRLQEVLVNLSSNSGCYLRLSYTPSVPPPLVSSDEGVEANVEASVETSVESERKSVIITEEVFTAENVVSITEFTELPECLCTLTLECRESNDNHKIAIENVEFTM
jgi:hypothetical protein